MKTFAVMSLMVWAMGCTYQIQEPGDNMNKYRGGETPIENVKGWSASGPLFTGDPNGSVRLQANFDTPESYTVSFSVDRGTTSTGGPAVIQTANAILKWAVEGNFVTREVTITDGMSVTGVGQGVDVKVFDKTQTQFFGGAGQKYTVAITCAPGERAGTAIPPTFPLVDPSNGQNFYDVVGAGSKTFNIPNGVGIISVQVTAITLSGNPIPNQGARASVSGGAGSVKSWDVQTVEGDFMPVVPGANLIQVANNLAGETVRFTIVFGIDG